MHLRIFRDFGSGSTRTLRVGLVPYGILKHPPSRETCAKTNTRDIISRAGCNVRRCGEHHHDSDYTRNATVTLCK
eukprot:2459465-Amphidinium_carterae.1